MPISCLKIGTKVPHASRPSDKLAYSACSLDVLKPSADLQPPLSLQHSTRSSQRCASEDVVRMFCEGSESERGAVESAAKPQTKNLDSRGDDSSRFLILRGGIPRSIGNSTEI